MLVMVVFFIAFRWIHLSTPLIRLFLLVLILLLMPTLNFLPVWFALSLLRFRLPSRLPMMFILWMVAMMVVIIPSRTVWRKMRKFDLSLRSSRSSYFATFRHQLTILSKTDALDEEKWLNMLGTFVKDWFRYESHFVHGRDSLVDILKERGLLSESDAVQPLIGKKS